jgi:hypothetical protein
MLLSLYMSWYLGSAVRGLLNQPHAAEAETVPNREVASRPRSRISRDVFASPVQGTTALKGTQGDPSFSIGVWRSE